MHVSGVLMQTMAQTCKPATFPVDSACDIGRWPGIQLQAHLASTNVFNAVLYGAAEVPVTYDQGGAGVRHLCSHLSWPVQQQLHCT